MFHTLRHFCASSMLAEGVNPMAVAGHLGDTLETLQRVYSHWMRDDRDVPATALDGILRVDHAEVVGSRREPLASHAGQPKLSHDFDAAIVGNRYWQSLNTQVSGMSTEPVQVTRPLQHSPAYRPTRHHHFPGREERELHRLGGHGKAWATTELVVDLTVRVLIFEHTLGASQTEASHRAPMGSSSDAKPQVRDVRQLDARDPFQRDVCPDLVREHAHAVAEEHGSREEEDLVEHPGDIYLCLYGVAGA